MLCAYRRDADICLHAATEWRTHHLNEKDTVDLIFCPSHALAYDAIEWAKRKRAENDG